MGVAQAAVYMVRPATSYRLLAYGEGAREVGLVAAAFALLPIFLAIPLGRLSDRRGAPLLLVGCAAQTAGCLFLAVSTATLTIAVASAVVGLGHLALALGAQDVIARESDSARHDQHFGLLTAGVSLGQLVGPLLVGLILGAGAAPSAAATTNVMLVAAAIAALATACAAVADRNTGPPGSRVDARRGSVRAIVSTRGVPGGIFASVAVLSAADVFTAYLPVIGESRDIGPRAIGALLALRAAASIAARVGIGGIVRRVGRTRLISIGATAAAAAPRGDDGNPRRLGTRGPLRRRRLRARFRPAPLDDPCRSTRPRARTVDRARRSPDRQPHRPGGDARRCRRRRRKRRSKLRLLAAGRDARRVRAGDPPASARSAG